MRYFNNIKMWLALVVVTLAACTEEVYLVKDIQPQTITMKLNGGVIPFDADNATRASDWEWKDGDVIYLQLYNGTTRIPGKATYNQGLWSVDYVTGTGPSGKCEVYYFDGYVTPESFHGVYGETDGTYTVENGEIVVNASISPMTGRIKFEGDYFAVSGLSYYSNYDYSTNEFKSSVSTFSNPRDIYLYCWFSDEHNRSLRVSNTNTHEKFTRSFGTNVLQIGKSGKLTIPTKDNYESLGWTWENKPVDIEAVDLGLPSGLLWANMNVGATKPEDYGDYFAWGETKPKSDYIYDTYKWMTEGQSSYKYVNKYQVADGYTEACWYNSSGQFIGDGKSTLELDDDAARVNWGGKWRMPTYTELDELKTECTWTWITTYNGENGYKVIGPNKNSIFLPAAGYCDSRGLVFAVVEGHYWSSSLRTTPFPYSLNFDDDYHGWGGNQNNRGMGQSVRPVYGPILSVSPDEVNFSATGSDIIVNVRANVDWTIESAPVWLQCIRDGDETITLIAHSNPLTEPRDGEVVFVTTDGSNLSAKVNVTQEGRPEPTGSPVAVDLGLPSGTLWANMNLGAEKSEDVGLYFAWGETTAHTGNDGYSFDWNNYKWCKGGDYNNMTKYYHDTWGDGGWVPSETLQSDDDAATQWDKWNGSWRMPTEQEIEELLDKNNTSSKWETINGVEGLKITSKKYSDIFIFLPAAGYIEGTKKIVGENYYWSATINSVSFFEVFDQYAWSIMFNANNKKTDQKDRCLGFPIRPVQSK